MYIISNFSNLMGNNKGLAVLFILLKNLSVYSKIENHFLPIITPHPNEIG
jgi:hypothetical protein